MHKQRRRGSRVSIYMAIGESIEESMEIESLQCGSFNATHAPACNLSPTVLSVSMTSAGPPRMNSDGNAPCFGVGLQEEG